MWKLHSTFMEENSAFMEDYSTFMEDRWKILSKHAYLAFLGQFRFWMDIIWLARWNGLEILIPKHMWKSEIRLPEPK